MTLKHHKIIDKLNREQENRRIHQAELSFRPLFWLVIVLSLIAFYTGIR
jgi:4-hydroxybenzoate polyprenyltransferase